MAPLTLIPVNRLSTSQLEVIMETLQIMILNALPFMMHLDMFVMITKEEGKKFRNCLHSRGVNSMQYIRPVVHTE